MYSERFVRRQMEWLGYSDEEIERTTDDLASDWHDRQKDYELEDKHEGKDQ